MKTAKFFAVVVCAVAGASAFAAGSSPLPQETVQGNVSYVSGGVGKDEADAMKQAEGRYPLSLEFSEHGDLKGAKGDFVADVNLTIEDKSGNAVLTNSSAGPYVLATLPDGKYTVKAEEHGKTQVRHVTVINGKPERISLVW